jgi:hypothetical protein
LGHRTSGTHVVYRLQDDQENTCTVEVTAGGIFIPLNKTRDYIFKYLITLGTAKA